MRAGPWTVVLEKALESPLNWKEIQPVHPKGDQSWVFTGRTDVEAETPILWSPDVEELTHLKRPWFWERLRTEGEGNDRGQDGWMASLTRWTWVWVNSGNWWWPGRPGVLRFMASLRVGHDWATELNWTVYTWPTKKPINILAIVDIMQMANEWQHLWAHLVPSMLTYFCVWMFVLVFHAVLRRNSQTKASWITDLFINELLPIWSSE